MCLRGHPAKDLVFVFVFRRINAFAFEVFSNMSKLSLPPLSTGVNSKRKEIAFEIQIHFFSE